MRSTSIVRRDPFDALFAYSSGKARKARMDTLETLFAYSEGKTRTDTLESLYNYSREDMCMIEEDPESSRANEGGEPSGSQNQDESRDDVLGGYLGQEGGMLTRVTDNLACCTRNIRVSDYMDERFLEEDFYELVYRPSRRPGTLHNVLSSSPSYDEGPVRPALSSITETDEKTVLTIHESKVEMSLLSFAPIQMDYEKLSHIFCGDLGK